MTSPLASDAAPAAEQATIGRICRYFLRLGALGFGGPIALAGYMQRDLVEDRRWVSEQEYRDGLAIAQMAPGPLAAQLAMWLAFVRTGARGATLASLAFVAPSFVLVAFIATLYVAFGGAAWVGSLFYGVAPAAMAIVAVSAYRLVPLTIGRDPLLALVAIVVGALTYFSEAEVALAFLLGGGVVVVVRVGPRSIYRGVSSHGSRGLPAFALLGPILPAAATDPSTLGALGLFFAKAGAFVFGSGLAIVPFLHQGVVVDYRWLNEQQFVDAVAVGLITPGPVVITAAFVGFLVAGMAGAVVAAFGVFLPAYLLVVVPGRWFLRQINNPVVRAFVAGVSAAATGAIVAAAALIARQAIRDGPTAAIGLFSLVALLAIRRAKRLGLGRVAEPVVVGVGALAGVLLRGI